MTFFMHILGTLTAFAVVMLAASLMIAMFVRVLHYFGKQRGQTLAEMLGALNIGFRREHGDTTEPADDPQTAFVLDVLSDPVLYPSSALRKPVARMPTPAKLDDDERKKVVLSVEYLDKQDLLDIVRKQAHDGVLPKTWSTHLSPSVRTYESFAAYVERWFRTVEGVSSAEFRRRTHRLVGLISSIVVVLFNMDGFEIVRGLHDSPEARAELIARAPDMLRNAEEINAADDSFYEPPQDRMDLLDAPVELGPLNAVLNEPAIGIGWHGSWIAQRYCAYKGQCAKEARLSALAEAAKPARPKPFYAPVLALLERFNPFCSHPHDEALAITGFEMLADVTRWVLGLLFSCVMLSLGAPFWADRLKDLMNLTNAVQKAKTSSGSAGTPSDTSALDPAAPSKR